MHTSDESPGLKKGTVRLPTTAPPIMLPCFKALSAWDDAVMPMAVHRKGPRGEEADFERGEVTDRRDGSPTLSMMTNQEIDLRMIITNAIGPPSKDQGALESFQSFASAVSLLLICLDALIPGELMIWTRKGRPFAPPSAVGEEVIYCRSHMRITK